MDNLCLRYLYLCSMYRYIKILVSELLGWVRNVVLINVYLDLENPGGSGFRLGGYMSQMREWGS
jgi:hypothetical protein